MNITLIFIISTIVIIAIFDVWVIWKKGKSESISAHLIRMTKKMPLIAFLFGILTGHLLWSMKTDDIYPDVECKKIEESVIRK